MPGPDLPFEAKEALGQDISMIIPEGRRGEERVILGRVLQGEKIRRRREALEQEIQKRDFIARAAQGSSSASA